MLVCGRSRSRPRKRVKPSAPARVRKLPEITICSLALHRTKLCLVVSEGAAGWAIRGRRPRASTGAGPHQPKAGSAATRVGWSARDGADITEARPA